MTAALQYMLVENRGFNCKHFVDLVVVDICGVLCMLSERCDKNTYETGQGGTQCRTTASCAEFLLHHVLCLSRIMC
jgi:hypothetical protein